MKSIFTLIVVSLSIFGVWAQSPQKMSYQAVIRNSGNQLLVDQSVGIQISILQTVATGISVYSETHQATTNANGLVSIEIGTGQTSQVFSSIDWDKGPYFLKTEIDPAGGTNYTITGTTQLLSVPFSLYSTRAETVIYEKQTLADVIDNYNRADGQIKEVSTPTDPKDAVNKEYVTLGISETGDSLFLGKNQSVIIPGISMANVKAPTVNTLQAQTGSTTTSTLAGTITDNGWNEITEYGFEYSTTQGFAPGTGTKVEVSTPITKGDFFGEITGLTEDQLYYFKAFAKNHKGTTYGEEKTFTTFQVLSSSDPASSKISSVIGWGYDIADKYANSTSIRSSVLDYNLMAADKLIKSDENQNSVAILSASGSIFTAYQSSMTVEAEIKGSYGAFGGELKGRYDRKKSSRDEFSFGTVSKRLIRTAYTVDKNYLFDLPNLYKYRTAAFVKDIMTLDTATIWARYGTDVLLGGMWGGRADYNMSARKHNNSSGSDIGVYVKARYDGVIASGSSSVDIDKKYSEEFETSSVDALMTGRGGNNAVITGPADLAAWGASINDGNEVFMEYYPGTVIPIYEFIEDATRKAEIKRLREEHLKHYVLPVVTTHIPYPVNQSFSFSNFTDHKAGDKDINSQSGRNTIINVTVTVNKLSANVIRCLIYLDVKEEHSDNTEFSGSQTFDIQSDKEVEDFIQMQYVSGAIKSSGKNHNFVDITPQSINWIPYLQVRFDSDSSNDESSIGIKGTLNFTVQTRSPFE